VSPKSRGRPPGRGRAKKPNRTPARPPHPADEAIADARDLLNEPSRLLAEISASSWLGKAWISADAREHDPEQMLFLGVVGRAHNRPTPQAHVAVHALRLVAPASEYKLLDESIAMLDESFAAPTWAGTAPPEPVAAYVADDPWGSEQGLLIEYGGDDPHCLLAHVTYAGGTVVQTIGLVEAGTAQGWDERIAEDETPMPLVERPIEEVFGKLDAALRYSARLWPKHDDDGYVDLRALAAARCAAVLPNDIGEDASEWEPTPEAEQEVLIDDFIRESGLPDDFVTRSVAGYCIDYGDGYIAGGVLAWSPDEVELFLLDWLPRKTMLDAEQSAAVPAVTRAWVQFALTRAGLEQRWIDPVVAAVDECADEFAEANADEAAWGPSKQVLMDLVARGVDLSDPDELEAGMRAYNAEQLARRALDE
jgi:hypothetical protein